MTQVSQVNQLSPIFATFMQSNAEVLDFEAQIRSGAIKVPDTSHIAFPMEMHLVNKDANGKLTVVGLFINARAKNETLAPLWDKLPAPDAAPQDAEVDLTALLPKDRSALVYSGSLTTPPCSEDVNWIVLENPIEMSPQQIEAFRKLLHENNRPIQPTNGRRLLQEL
jgi:carbonic anhydrase